MDLDNYRGITLMDVVGKVFSSILRNRLEIFYEGRIVEEHAGFRKDKVVLTRATHLHRLF